MVKLTYGKSIIQLSISNFQNIQFFLQISNFFQLSHFSHFHIFLQNSKFFITFNTFFQIFSSFQIFCLNFQFLFQISNIFRHFPNSKFIEIFIFFIEMSNFFNLQFPIEVTSKYKFLGFVDTQFLCIPTNLSEQNTNMRNNSFW